MKIRRDTNFPEFSAFCCSPLDTPGRSRVLSEEFLSCPNQIWLLLRTLKTICVRLQKLLLHKCGQKKNNQISVDFTLDLWTVEISTVLTDFGGISTLCQTLWEDTTASSTALQAASSLGTPSGNLWTQHRVLSYYKSELRKFRNLAEFTWNQRGGRIFHENQLSSPHLWGSQLGQGWSQRCVWGFKWVK